MKTQLTLVLLLITSIFLIASVRAEGEVLLCLESGDRLEFSDCNPDIDDYVCHQQTCQICARQLPSGVYCPAAFNLCDSACITFNGGGIGEEPLPADAPVITLGSPADNYAVAQSQRIDFVYTVTRYNTIKSCSLVIDGEIEKSKSTTSSGNNLIYFTVPNGDHTWKISCKTRAGTVAPTELTINSATRTLHVGTTSPPPQNNSNSTNPPPSTASIALLNPEDNSFSSTSSVSFSFDYIGATSAQVTSCKLYIDSTPYSISKTSRSLTKSLSPGQHSWQVKCTSSTLGELSSPTRSITVNDPNNPTPEGITLSSPANGFSATGQQDVTFSFSFAGISSSQISSCALDLNGQQINVDKTSRSHSQSLAPGSYTWNVKCTKSSSGDLTSESRTLTINTASSGGGSSGGGSSGGGGGGGSSGGSGSRSTAPKTTSNTAADNTIKLSDTKNTDSDEPIPNIDDQVEEQSGSRINGAVTAINILKNNWLLSLLLLLLVLAIIFLIIIFSRRKESSEPKMNQSFKKK